MSCSKGDTDYDLAGSKTSGKVLEEAGTVLASKGGLASNVYTQPACTPITNVQAQDFTSQQQSWVGHRRKELLSKHICNRRPPANRRAATVISLAKNEKNT